MQKYIKTSHNDFVIDTSTSAVINTNNTEYEKIKAQRKAARIINDLTQEVETLKAEVNMLKQHIFGNCN